MPSLTAKDRIPLCLFSYEDHRRCRTPRITTHPHFCFYHAQKESQSQAAGILADDLAYFFSGKYLSANDLNAALGRLIPAVIRGEIKPRLARTVAYMLQTLMQSTRQAQHEYINAFSTDGWRQAICDSVNANHDHLYPSARASQNDADLDANADPVANSQMVSVRPAEICHAERSEAPRQDRPAPPTNETGQPSATHRLPTAAEAALNIARNLFPERPSAVGSAFQDGPPTQSAPPNATAAPTTNPVHHALQSPPAAPTINPATPTQTTPSQPTDPTPPPSPRRQPGAPTRDPYSIHYDHNYRLIVDGKPFSNW